MLVNIWLLIEFNLLLYAVIFDAAPIFCFQDLYGSFASSADSTVTDTDSSCESIYTDTMEDGQRPLFIMGDEDGKLSSTCTQGVSQI